MYDLTQMKVDTMLHKRSSLTLAAMTILAVAPISAAQAEDLWSNQTQAQTQVTTERSWASPQKEEGNWVFELGGGAIYGTEYEGSDEYEVKALPYITAEYKDGLFFANPFDGIGSYPLRGENYKLGASIGVDFGRDEDDSDDLRGMGDIDMSATVNLMGEYDLGALKFSAKLTKGDDDYGMTAEADVGTMWPVTRRLMVMGKVGTKWADEDNMKTYFGVSSAQAGRSVYSQYTPDAGFKSVGVTVSGFYSITENWNAMLMVSGDQLIGDAADSPIVKQEFQPMTMFSASCKF
jgi:outer membrane protein